MGMKYEGLKGNNHAAKPAEQRKSARLPPIGFTAWQYAALNKAAQLSEKKLIVWARDELIAAAARQGIKMDPL